MAENYVHSKIEQIIITYNNFTVNLIIILIFAFVRQNSLYLFIKLFVSVPSEVPQLSRSPPNCCCPLFEAPEGPPQELSSQWQSSPF